MTWDCRALHVETLTARNKRFSENFWPLSDSIICSIPHAINQLLSSILTAWVRNVFDLGAARVRLLYRSLMLTTFLAWLGLQRGAKNINYNKFGWASWWKQLLLTLMSEICFHWGVVCAELDSTIYIHRHIGKSLFMSECDVHTPLSWMTTES